jgi:hypothetical protein
MLSLWSACDVGGVDTVSGVAVPTPQVAAMQWIGAHPCSYATGIEGVSPGALSKAGPSTRHSSRASRIFFTGQSTSPVKKSLRYCR